MTADDVNDAQQGAPPVKTPVWLEHLTALVLIGVMAAVGWMIAAAYSPDFARLASPEIEVIVVLGLLVAALGLVSLVALWHTRR